ncbi:metal ABC transporter substrate-binding protein [Sulfurimonas sp. HSL-1716]|uniref:metal ABC transporter substrate-binding protein n=1 Tax=Hydrocurvibacter sulfurireducens TaxID=3131937 RepID=UPI0031FA3AAE
MKTIKTISILLILLVGAFTYYNLHSSGGKEAHKYEQKSKPLIALSTYALYDAAKNIAGDSMECFCVLPYGVEVHDFEPTPKLMAKLHDSDLVVYSGAGLEPWTHTFEDEKNGLDMSGYVKLLDAAHHEDEKEGHRHELQFDPHYWLDVDNMITAVNVLKEKFTKILPANKELYSANAEAYIAKLKEIDVQYRQKMSACKLDTIVVDHNAFSYLAVKYGFHVESVSGLSPDAQPSAKVMNSIIDKVKDKNISTIFFESFASDKVINAIAEDTKVTVDMLQPIANITKKESEEGATYYSLMIQNLQKISEARECR